MVRLWQHGEVKSVRTALRVFEEVAACQPVGLSELSRRLDVPKASVQRALTTLANVGWLRHDVNQPGLWVVTARFSVLADASPSVIAARDAARPLLRSLREKADGAAGFFVLDGDRMVMLAGPEESTLRAQQSTYGPLPVHVSAAGRAILAQLPDATVEEILHRVLPDAATGEDPAGHDGASSMAEHVRQSIHDARHDGYAVVQGEYVDDLGVVAAAVVDGDGAPVAGLAVMVPLDRLRDGNGPELGTLVMRAAQSVSLAVQVATGAR
jgi:IclR family transcriptional regulator, acetate operon repressor